MPKILCSKEKRKLNKIKKNISEALLLSGGDPSQLNDATEALLRYSLSGRDIPLNLSKKLRAMRHLKDSPKMKLSLNRLNDARIGSRNIAELVHYVTFRNVDKPLWITVKSHRNILQTVVIRVSCDLEMVDSNKNGTYIGELFGSSSSIRMHNDVWNKKSFWTALLNIPPSKLECLNKILSRSDILKEHIRSDSKAEILVSLQQMINFGYPFPGTSEESVENVSLPTIVSIKEKYGTVNDNSPFFAIDCEMCTTESGESELTRISVVDENYEVLLDTLVKPRNKITDYVTKYSGITKGMLENVDVRLEDVQKALSHILPNDAILVGHTLECDFKALRITHPYCVDMSFCLNLSGKDRQRSSLKTLARIFLDEEIQGKNAHCSVDDAIITMRLLKYKLLRGAQFGNVSMGWNFDDWARENGVTNSGVRIKNNKNSAAETDIIQEPQRKKKHLISETVIQSCIKCGRPMSVGCIVTNCTCKIKYVKHCVMCCADAVPPQSSNKEPSLTWNESFRISSDDSDTVSYYLRLQDKSALFAIPSYVKTFETKENEVYVNTDEYDSLDELAERVSADVISHNIIMMDIDATEVKMKKSEKPIVAVCNALRKVTSHASWNSLIIVVLSSPEKSICHLTVKAQSKRKNLDGSEYLY